MDSLSQVTPQFSVSNKKNFDLPQPQKNPYNHLPSGFDRKKVSGEPLNQNHRNISFSDLNENEGDQDSLALSDTNLVSKHPTSFHRKVNSFNAVMYDGGHKLMENNNNWSENRSFNFLNSSSELKDIRIAANEIQGRKMKFKDDPQNSEVDDKIRNLEGK